MAGRLYVCVQLMILKRHKEDALLYSCIGFVSQYNTLSYCVIYTYLGKFSFAAANLQQTVRAVQMTYNSPLISRAQRRS